MIVKVQTRCLMKSCCTLVGRLSIESIISFAVIAVTHNLISMFRNLTCRDETINKDTCALFLAAAYTLECGLTIRNHFQIIRYDMCQTWEKRLGVHFDAHPKCICCHENQNQMHRIWVHIIPHLRYPYAYLCVHTGTIRPKWTSQVVQTSVLKSHCEVFSFSFGSPSFSISVCIDCCRLVFGLNTTGRNISILLLPAMRLTLKSQSS